MYVFIVTVVGMIAYTGYKGLLVRLFLSLSPGVALVGVAQSSGEQGLCGCTTVSARWQHEAVEGRHAPQLRQHTSRFHICTSCPVHLLTLWHQPSLLSLTALTAEGARDTERGCAEEEELEAVGGDGDAGGVG
jgi:hypothetical protein